MPDLVKMLDERQSHPLMKARNDAYKIFENYIQSKGKKGDVQLTFKPFAQMDIRGTGDDHKLAINLSRRVHSYFTATFSTVPETWKQPKTDDPADKEKAERLSWWLVEDVYVRSRTQAGQPRQASFLSGRGDCVFGVDWENNDHAKEVLIRTYDPMFCYPTLDPFDVGGVQDILIVFNTSKTWAEKHYGISLPDQGKSEVRVLHYWDADHFEMQVEEKKVPAFERKHKLGICPFRWVFGSADGNFAQSDIRDIPSLQDFYNENLLLAMDSIRKEVDKAYIVFGVNKDLTPKPGMAIGVKSSDAKLQEFPAGADAQVIMQVGQMLEAAVESTTGISSTSARGQVQGIGTGAAIRNQVQAVEARNEARKQAFADAYAMVGNYCMRVLEKEFGETKLGVSGRKDMEVSGADVDGFYLCQADYGGFVGMEMAQRIQASLSGLGRVYDDLEAIRLARLPGVNPLEMRKRIDDYQTRQAVTAAKAQALAQQAMQTQSAQEPSPGQVGQEPTPPGAIPQKAQPAPPPAPAQRGLTTLGDIERTLQSVKNQLHGTVWAVGELAVAGIAAQPLLMVSSEKDLPIVTGLMQALHTHVLPGHPGQIPSLALA